MATLSSVLSSAMLEHGCDDFDDVNKVLKALAEGAKLVDEGHAAEKDRINTEFDKAKYALNEEIKKVNLLRLVPSRRRSPVNAEGLKS